MTVEEKIVKFATQKFLSIGFKKITMDQLASGLKISKKTIYKYFPSKIYLIKKVILTFQIGIRNKLNSIVNSNNSLTIKLEQVGEFFAEFFHEIDEKLLTDFLQHNPELWEMVDNFRRNVLESVWKQLIIQGQQEGVIIKGENKIIVQFILATLRSIIDPEFLTKNRINMNDAFNQVFIIIINGIFTEKGRKEFENHKRKENE